MLLLRVIVFAAGLALAGAAFLSALRAFVLPRAVSDALLRRIFLGVRFLFDLRLARAVSFQEQDQVMAVYAPLTVFALLALWLSLALLGYAGMFWALGVEPFEHAVLASASSLVTLGYSPPPDLATGLLAFTEGALGMTFIALLIAYLPIMYTAFSRREAAVSLLEVRAGSPASAVEMLTRIHRIGAAHELAALWERWEVWFVELEESHTSLAPLAFFRSPQPHRSWVTAAGTVLDSAALHMSAIDGPNDPGAALCLRAGYLALRQIATLFEVDFDPDPKPVDPIAITRSEFEAALDELATAGLTLRGDRQQAWADFAGWRVNYDTVLLALADLTMAPPAPWSSDRGPVRRRLFRRRRPA